MIFIDSPVVACAWAERRSSSRRLNTCLRCALAWQMFCWAKVVVAWIPTNINPSGCSSRGVPLRAPIPLTLSHPKNLIYLEGKAVQNEAGYIVLSRSFDILGCLGGMFVFPSKFLRQTKATAAVTMFQTTSEL